MPSSAVEGKAKIRSIVNSMIRGSGFRLLDLGCGRGTYARLITKLCYKIGVDAVDYRKKFELDKWYDEFYQHDIRDTEWIRRLGRFDLAIAGDVLEHMTVEQAQNVLEAMQDIAKAVLVAVPYTYPQKGRGGNRWEDHIQDDLTPALMKELEDGKTKNRD